MGNSIRWKNQNRGFTLIELLVVITIIGILSAVVIVFLAGARSKGRDAQRISDVKQLKNALELYRAETGHYPDTAASCGSHAPNTSWCNSILQSGGGTNVNNHWIRDRGTTEVLAQHLKIEPTDPKQKTVLRAGVLGCTATKPTPEDGIFYYSTDSSRWYMIVYVLENPNSSVRGSGVVTACDGTQYDYSHRCGWSDLNIITTGMSCN